MTLSTYCASWLEYGAQFKAKGTIRRYAATLKSLCSSLGERPLAEVTPSELKQWQLKRAGDVVEATLAVDTVVVRALFRSAVEDRAIDTSPAAGLLKPSLTAPAGELGATWEEARGAIEEHAGEPERSALLLLLATGLRLGELLHLRPEDVVVGVASVRAHDGWTPKTRSSTRRVPLGPVGASALAALAEYPQNGRLVSLGASVRASEDRLRKALKAACKAAGLPKLGPHKLRHAYATRLAEMGVHPEIARRLLGHARLEQLQTYTHPGQSAMRQAVEGC